MSDSLATPQQAQTEEATKQHLIVSLIAGINVFNKQCDEYKKEYEKKASSFIRRDIEQFLKEAELIHRYDKDKTYSLDHTDISMINDKSHLSVKTRGHYFFFDLMFQAMEHLDFKSKELVLGDKVQSTDGPVPLDAFYETIRLNTLSTNQRINDVLCDTISKVEAATTRLHSIEAVYWYVSRDKVIFRSVKDIIESI